MNGADEQVGTIQERPTAEGGWTVPPAPGPAPGAGPDRLLRRTTDDRVLFGVAGGLARYLGVDPVVVRVAFVLLAVFGGSGVLLYLIGLIAIPEERPGDATGAVGTAPRPGGGTVAVVLGAALVLIGALTLIGQVFPGAGDLVGPLLLLGAGALVIVWGGRR
jgi:phage shock protein C